MDIRELQRMLVDHKASMLSEGFLNDQFTQLQQSGDPDLDFHEYLTGFFVWSMRILDEIEMAIEKDRVDLKNVDDRVCEIEGASFHLGALRLGNACTTFHKYCEEERNLDECLTCLDKIKDEYTLVKNKRDRLVSLENQIVAAGGSIPKE